jgi:alkylation response protein AidB-like acyl-CoA dehydrogenase
MSITEKQTAAPVATYPTPVRPDDDRFVSLAAEVGAVASAHAEQHDRDATFVSEAYDAMRANGYLRLAVPVVLGGLGASIRQVCYAQAELARHDEATALAVTMHLYLTLMQGFRRRNGAVDADAVLRRVAEEGLVIATSGGSDWLWPNTVAVPVDGEGDGEEPDGFRVSGRKAFCSQSPGAIDELGDDYAADASTIATVMVAKRQAVTDAIAVVDLVMDVLGGRAYFRSAALERAYRDVRAGTFHPLTPEATLAYAGKLALGDPGATE